MNDVSRRAFRGWVLAAGIFNLVSSFPLSMPFLYKMQYGMLDSANRALGLGGEPLSLPRGAVNMLFVNTGGLILCSVGLMLIWAARDLKNRYGVPLFNALTRIIWAALVFHYVIKEDLARIVIAFAISDLVFAGALLYYVTRERQRVS